MKLAGSRRLAAFAATSALALTLAACGNGDSDNDEPTTEDETTEEADADAGDDVDEETDDEPAAELSGNLPGAGASSHENAMVAWTQTFMEEYPDVQVSYEAVGSGDGRSQFLAGATLWGGSDSIFNDEELEQGAERCFDGEVLELPMYISPIAVAYNLPELEGENLNLEPETLAEIFNGDITSWDDPAIAESNPDAELPSTEIVPVNRSDDSGTTDNFTDYLEQASGGAWPHEASGTWPVSGTQSGAQTSGVVSTLQAAEGTIAYLDASQVPEGMGTVAVGVGDSFVPFSAEAAANVVDVSSEAEGASDLRLRFDLARDTDEDGAYPIVLVAYTFACSMYENEQDVANIQEFLRHVASPEFQELAADPEVAGSAPISDNLRERILNAVDQISVS